MNIKPTQHNLDLLLTWKQMLEDLLKDHSLLGSHAGLCSYLECGKGKRVLYLKLEVYTSNTSYGYICEFMDDNDISGYMEETDYGIMSKRRISLTKQLLVQIEADILNIQTQLS